MPEPKQWSPVSYATKCAKRRDDPNRGVYGVRETVLAQLRNECLHHVKMTHAKEEYDYLVTLDMDIFRIDDQGVLDSFGAIAWMDDEESPWSGKRAPSLSHPPPPNFPHLSLFSPLSLSL